MTQQRCFSPYESRVLRSQCSQLTPGPVRPAVHRSCIGMCIGACIGTAAGPIRRAGTSGAGQGRARLGGRADPPSLPSPFAAPPAVTMGAGAAESPDSRLCWRFIDNDHAAGPIPSFLPSSNGSYPAGVFKLRLEAGWSFSCHSAQRLPCLRALCFPSEKER